MSLVAYQLAFLGQALAAEQRLLLQVELPEGHQDAEVVVEVERMGEVHPVALVDDGRQEGDIPGDGILVGWQEGPYQRHTPLRLVVDGAEVYATHEKTYVTGVVRVGWELVPVGEGLAARRNAAVRPGALPHSDRGLSLVVGFGWGGLALLYLGGLVFLHRRS